MRSFMGTKRHNASKNKSRTKARAGKRLVFEEKCPPGLSPSERKAWEAAAVHAGGAVWTPEKPGDMITGKLLSSQEEKSKFGPQRVLMLDTKDGKKRVYCSTVLASEFERAAPKVGQTLLILFKGLAGGKRGRPAKIFGLSIVGK